MGEAQDNVVTSRVADVRGTEMESCAYAESRGRASNAGSEDEAGEKTNLSACADLQREPQGFSSIRAEGEVCGGAIKDAGRERLAAWIPADFRAIEIAETDPPMERLPDVGEQACIHTKRPIGSEMPYGELRPPHSEARIQTR